MTNKELNYIEGKSPLLSYKENLNFRQWQLSIYKMLYDLIKQGFSRDNFIAKMNIIAKQIMQRSNNYFVCRVVDSGDFIIMEFYVANHAISKAIYEIRYEDDVV